MKKILTVLLAALMLAAVSGCGGGKETADSYADKLARGEIEPDVEIEEDERGVSHRKSEDDDITDDYEIEDDELPENVGGETVEYPDASLAVSETEMAALVDAFDNDYKSFEIIDIPSADFFIDKKLRLAALVQNHELENRYDAGITALFTRKALSIDYVSNGENIHNECTVYKLADTPVTTPEGNSFSYIAYGDGANPSESDSIIGIAALVTINGVDMADAAADEYVMFIETSDTSLYQIFKIEE